ncbi:class I adenylate-forming enzyme family protein [Bradyrhizobium liaoningense]|uniref:class I adenylate-forming enzyme family protein n=1 Tax=Bradyrhizobium liaoningense TaxID=43992 RepID=UPI001BADB2F2|nr:class I adenylate-forming enzyme family protein [Bradyrhizobium liaoningense]MBR1031495.1 acyl--CoA ligase [Bradyrhizobium liaoningense]
MSAAARMIIDSVDDLARRFSDFGDGTPRYDKLYEAYARLALKPGSAVLIFAPNGVEFLLHWIAALANGYVPCAIPPSAKTSFVAELRKSLKIAAIVGPHLNPALYQAKQSSAIGTLNSVVCDLIPPPYEPFDVLILTTGTSGSQTACVHTVESLACNAIMTNRTLNITAADRQLCVLPMYHSYGLVTQSIGSMLSGCELKIDGPPFNANRFADLIRKERISICGVTPTIARDLLRKGTVLPDLRSMSIGGDRMSPEDVTSLLGKPFINELYITYGLTEAGPRVSVLPAHIAPVEAYDSVGMAFSGVFTRIDAPDADGVGQLLVKTPSVCRRKVGENLPRQPFTSDGFLETGDLFTKDAAGYLRYVARKTDILIVKGEKLNVRSIDAVAELHPDIEFARTTAGDMNSLVTRLWAKDDKTLDLDEIRVFVKSSLRLHEVPDKFIQERNAVFHK